MKNRDLKRFHDVNFNDVKAKDFVRLDEEGKIPSEVLPSYVDEVVEGYYYNNKFYEESSHATEIIPSKSKIYVDLVSGDAYRWSGSRYNKVGPITLDDLLDLMEGSDHVVVDLNEDEDKIRIDLDASAKSFNISLSQLEITLDILAKLKASPTSFITYSNEHYYLADDHWSDLHFAVYSHVGRDNGGTFIKSMYVYDDQYSVEGKKLHCEVEVIRCQSQFYKHTIVNSAGETFKIVCLASSMLNSYNALISNFDGIISCEYDDQKCNLIKGTLSLSAIYFDSSDSSLDTILLVDSSSVTIVSDTVTSL